jgi:hypothetical protein
MVVHRHPHLSSIPTPTADEHARVTTFDLDPHEPDLEGAVRRLGETAVAALSREPGFDGAYVVADADGRGAVVSLWRPRRGRGRAALEVVRRAALALRHLLWQPADRMRDLEPS